MRWMDGENRGVKEGWGGVGGSLESYDIQKHKKTKKLQPLCPFWSHRTVGVAVVGLPNCVRAVEFLKCETIT